MRFKTTVEGMEVALIITEPVIDTSWPLTTEGKGVKLGHRNGQFVRGAVEMEVASSIVTTWTTSDVPSGIIGGWADGETEGIVDGVIVGSFEGGFDGILDGSFEGAVDGAAVVVFVG